eukprot:738800_1
MEDHHHLTSLTSIKIIFLTISFVLAIILFMANPNPPETDYIDNHDIVEIGDHPLLPDNHDARLVQAVLQLECDDASDRCQDAINSHASMITANATYFNHIK